MRAFAALCVAAFLLNAQDPRESWKARTQPIRERLRQLEARLADIEQPARAKLLYSKYQQLEGARDTSAARLPMNPIWNRNFFAPAGAKRFRFVISAHKGPVPKLERFMIRGANSVEWGDWSGPRKATSENPFIFELPFSGRFWEITWSSDRTRGSENGEITTYRFEASDDGFKWRTIASSADHAGLADLEMPVVEESELVESLSPEYRNQRQRLLDEIARAKAELHSLPEPA